jgi:hypothetical protein
MASELYKHPKRTAKHYAKRSLILTEYGRQYKHRKNKSVLYQNALFHKYGSELSLFNTFLALTRTIKEFNAQYGDTLVHKHGVLLLLIKHYVVSNNLSSFKVSELHEYYPDLSPLLGAFTDSVRSFQRLFADLSHFHFINPLGYRFTTTTRLKIFCNMYEKHCKELFN